MKVPAFRCYIDAPTQAAKVATAAAVQAGALAVAEGAEETAHLVADQTGDLRSHEQAMPSRPRAAPHFSARTPCLHNRLMRPTYMLLFLLLLILLRRHQQHPQCRLRGILGERSAPLVAGRP